MINYIIGGIIIAFTLYVVVRAINRARKGKSICDCGGCDASCSSRKS